MNPWTVLERLFWGGAGGFLAVVVALAVGRLSSVHPGAKVWICRLAFLKAAVCLVWAATLTIPATNGTGTQLLSAELGWFLLALWSVGLVLVLLHFLKSYRAATTLRKAASPLSVPDLAGVEVRSAKGLNEPCVVGAIKPCLVMPEGVCVDGSVLSHELAHVRHRDLAWNGLAWIAYSAMWFVPGFGRLTREMWLWQEVRADLAARRATSVEPDTQARSLLDALTRPAPSSAALVTFSGDAAAVDRRIRAMFRSRFSAAITVGLVIVALAASVPVQMQGQSRSRVRVGLARLVTSSVPFEVASPN